MIVKELKKQLYNLLSQDLGYNVKDYAGDNTEESFPIVKLSLSTMVRDRYKNSSVEYRIRYKIDIFSDYDGEAEILDMEEAIFHKMTNLYNVEGVTQISNSEVRIIDDNSTGVMRKHGIVMYTFIIAGEEVQESDENSNSPEGD